MRDDTDQDLLKALYAKEAMTQSGLGGQGVIQRLLFKILVCLWPDEVARWLQ